MIISKGQINALAELIHHLRPGWNRSGIVAALQARPRPILELIRAAVDAAADPEAQTPAVIASRDGSAWASHESSPRVPPTPRWNPDHVQVAPPTREYLATRRALHGPRKPLAVPQSDEKTPPLVSDGSGC